MKRKSFFWGIALILTAVYLIVSRLGLMPGVPTLTLLFTLIFAALIIDGIIKRNIFEILIPAALLLCIYDEWLGIQAITPWPVLIAAILCSIGLNLIFGDIWKQKKNRAAFRNAQMNSQIDNSSDGSYVQVNNAFSGFSKYVNTNYLTNADIKNSFGKCNVYFNNAVMAKGRTEVKLSNSFGELNLYFPRTWRVHVERKVAFGAVNMRGMGNSDMDAPFVQVDADCSFGEVNIYFD